MIFTRTADCSWEHTTQILGVYCVLECNYEDLSAFWNSMSSKSLLKGYLLPFKYTLDLDSRFCLEHSAWKNATDILNLKSVASQSQGLAVDFQ